MLNRFLCRDPGCESNRLSISDPDTDILHLSPRDFINAMTALHGALTGVEVDALRLPLKKNILHSLTSLHTSSRSEDNLPG
jgi:hypothetical protein